MSSQQRILREINERMRQSMQRDEVNYLQLDSICIRHITKQMKHIIQSHPHIEYLTMNDCHLQSLSNFPKLDNLAMLQLSNNRYAFSLTYNSIQDESLFHLLRCSHISHLMIDQNRLRSIEKVSILRQLGNLEQLEIAGNAIGESQFYREELFDKIPQLKIIDCHDRLGNVAIDSQSQQDQQEQDQKILTIDVRNQSSSIKLQQKALLNLLENQQQEEEQINSCVGFGKLRQQQGKQQTAEAFDSLSQMNKQSGTKKLKLQQNANMNNQKLLNKNTVAESCDSNSPELQFCHSQSYHYQE